ncbi:hypothetical protein [Vibrio barjaei]|uniref:DUF7828 domain-containing protein n=1 Tax=Vibrio barjaei TaxID=1676683 RepID=UPI00228412DD|nr:hypothetical protein [Vibrio barjaei]MCY9872351.1 hypothetical protein [Vibrio barjaei]
MTDNVLMPFAYNKDKEIVTVYEVERGDNCNCTCLSCGSLLRARQGLKRTPHFAHRTNLDQSTTIEECSFSPITAIALLLKQEIPKLPRIKSGDSGANVSKWEVRTNASRTLFDAIAITDSGTRVGFYFPHASGLTGMDCKEIENVDFAYEVDPHRIGELVNVNHTNSSRRYIVKAILYNWDVFVKPIRTHTKPSTQATNPKDESSLIHQGLDNSTQKLAVPKPSRRSVKRPTKPDDKYMTMCLCCKKSRGYMARGSFCLSCVNLHVGQTYSSLQEMYKAYTGYFSS